MSFIADMIMPMLAMSTSGMTTGKKTMIGAGMAGILIIIIIIIVARMKKAKATKDAAAKKVETYFAVKDTNVSLG